MWFLSLILITNIKGQVAKAMYGDSKGTLNLSAGQYIVLYIC